GHRLDHVGAEILGVRAREPDPLDSVHGVHGAKELREPGRDPGREVTTVRVDVLAEQGDFADALVRERGHLGDDLARSAADLAAADVRDDAVGADGVAAHRDLYPCLHRALALRRKLGGEAALLLDAERVPSDPDAPGAEPVAEMADRAGAEGDVDERVLLEDALALGFG